MGTSISTTKTHQRIQQQRQQRKLNKYNTKPLNNEQFFPLHQRETTRENDITQKPQHQKINNLQPQTLQNYSINLKTHQQSNPQQQKIIEIKNNENKKIILPKKQSLKESTISTDQNKLTIRKNQPQKQINSQSSLQQITFSSKKIRNPNLNQDKPKVESINHVQKETQPKFELKNPQQHQVQPKIVVSPSKPNISLQTPVSQQEKPRLIKNQPVSLNPQFTQFADKQLSQKEKKRKEQAIKYIKDSQFLSGNKTLSNNPYQIGNKSPIKVEQLLPPSRSLAIDLSPKTQQNNKTSRDQTIKLKTQEQQLDNIKANHSMTLNKKNKNVSSFNTVNKKY